MIRGTGSDRSVMGYGAFISAVADKDPVLTRAVRPAVILLTDTTRDRDFREVRFREFALHLIELVEELDERRVPDHIQGWKNDVRGRRHPERRWLPLDENDDVHARQA